MEGTESTVRIGKKLSFDAAFKVKVVACAESTTSKCVCIVASFAYYPSGERFNYK